MAVIETWYNQDLQTPVKVHYLDGSLFSHNGNGNRIGVYVFDGGEPVTLAGTVSGYVVTADGSTVPCTGAKSGNAASILIPAAAYQPGSVFITIFLTDGTTVTTLASVSTSVLVARTGTQVDPGSVVSDWTDTINAAMQEVEDAAEDLGGIVAVPYASITFPVPLGKYTYESGKLYRCISPISTSETFTPSHWTEVRLGDDVSELKSALNESIGSLSISDSVTINSGIKELYISGQDLSEIDSLSVTKESTKYIFNFKKLGVSQFVMRFPLTGDYRISKENASTLYGIAIFNSNFDSVMLTSNMPCKFNIAKVTNINENPLICDHFFGSENAFSPSYTKTSSYRISTDGQVVSAGSAWFYSSPIQVKGGDVIYITCGGNASAAPLSLTDSTGSFYTPVITYSGTDPDDYTYTCKTDGYVCFSAPSGNDYPIYIIRPKDSPKVPMYIGTAYSGKVLGIGEDGLVVPVTQQGGSSDVDIDFLQIAKANNHNIRIPTPVQSVPIDTTSWIVADATVDGVYDVYDNVNNVMTKAVKITSTSNGNAYCNLPSAVNGNNYALMFSVLLDPAFDINTTKNGKGVEVILYSGSGRGLDNRWEAYIQYEDSSGDWESIYSRDGWCHETLSIGSMYTVDVGSSFDITDIRAVGVKIKHASGTTRSVYIANMSFVPLMQRPGILTIIDNFNPSVPDMADYAYSKGVRLNLSIVPGYYENAPSAPTSAPIEDLERIAEQGFHFIWDHTWQHLNLNTLTGAEIADQVNFAQEWMNNKGYQYSRGSDIISVPSGRFNTGSCNSLLATNAKMIFHSWHGFTAGQVYIPYYPGLRQIQTTKLDTDTSGPDSGTTLATYAAKAITYSGIAVIGFHGTFWERDDGDSWKEYVDAIALLDCHHYTLDEIYNGLWC